MNATKKPDGEKTVDESVSHYKAEKLADGRVKLSSGGHVSIAQTYYKALENFAKRQQEHIEDSPDHLRERHRESIYHDTVNPEIEDIVEPATDELKQEAIDFVKGEFQWEAETRGAWLARKEGTDLPGLGDEIAVYRLWDIEYTGGELEE